MSKSETVIDVAPGQMEAALQGVLDELSADFEDVDFSAALAAISRDIEDFERGLFENEKSPAGDAWAPLAPSTIARKGHDVILHETGRLGTSLFGDTAESVRDIYPHGLTFGTEVPYAIFHDTGTKNMPARVNVGLDDAMVDKIADKIGDAAVEHLKNQ